MTNCRYYCTKSQLKLQKQDLWMNWHGPHKDKFCSKVHGEKIVKFYFDEHARKEGKCMGKKKNIKVSTVCESVCKLGKIFCALQLEILYRYTGAKKYSHPYYINTIDMRSLWMGIEDH